MNIPELLKTIGERVQSNASVQHVYGAPVSLGDRTVIPVARVAYGFGGGGGAGDAQTSPPGGGGGGGASATPAGVVEITPSGTRFIPIPDWKKAIPLIAIAFGVGFAAGRHRKR